jgi:elongation factor P--(R)-beta-lysine ligase
MNAVTTNLIDGHWPAIPAALAMRARHSQTDYLPSASLVVLRRRAALLAWLRSFFTDHGYWEVQTPVLSRDVCIDAWLEPIAVPLSGGADAAPSAAYLQTSPEFAMKRLLSAGAEAIFEITPAFRKGESGPLHNPEFTLLEWYRVGDTYHDQMSFTEDLVAGFLEQARIPGEGEAAREGEAPAEPSSRENAFESALPRPFPRLTYAAAFREAIDIDPLPLSGAELQQVAAGLGVQAPASLTADDRDGWLNLLLAERVEPHLAQRPALFLHDYPASQAALARIRSDDPPVAERFELYLHGIEICNGYQELTDAGELRERFARQSELRSAACLPPLPQQSRLLEAMEHGLPECSGVALGLDRLLMIALGCTSIDEVIPFPWPRA